MIGILTDSQEPDWKYGASFKCKYSHQQESASTYNQLAVLGQVEVSEDTRRQGQEGIVLGLGEGLEISRFEPLQAGSHPHRSEYFRLPLQCAILSPQGPILSTRARR